MIDFDNHEGKWELKQMTHGNGQLDQMRVQGQPQFLRMNGDWKRKIRQDFERSLWIFAPSGRNAEQYNFKDTGKIDISYPTSTERYPRGDWQWRQVDERTIYIKNKDGVHLFQVGLND
jgi:hypothetical protein